MGRLTEFFDTRGAAGTHKAELVDQVVRVSPSPRLERGAIAVPLGTRSRFVTLGKVK